MSAQGADGTTIAQPAAAAQGPGDEEVLCFLDAMGALAPGNEGDGNLICILQDIQERFGYLPARALEEVARRLHTPLSRVYAVVSFYAQLYTEPRGRHTIRCCRGTACHVKGADRVLDMVRRTLGIDDGQTTPDRMFYLETIACLGTCFLAPAMMIDGQYYGKLTPRRVEQVLASYRTDG